MATHERENVTYPLVVPEYRVRVAVCCAALQCAAHGMGWLRLVGSLKL